MNRIIKFSDAAGKFIVLSTLSLFFIIFFAGLPYIINWTVSTGAALLVLLGEFTLGYILLILWRSRMKIPGVVESRASIFLTISRITFWSIFISFAFGAVTVFGEELTKTWFIFWQIISIMYLLFCLLAGALFLREGKKSRGDKIGIILLLILPVVLMLKLALKELAGLF